ASPKRFPNESAITAVDQRPEPFLCAFSHQRVEGSNETGCLVGVDYCHFGWGAVTSTVWASRFINPLGKRREIDVGNGTRRSDCDISRRASGIRFRGPIFSHSHESRLFQPIPAKHAHHPATRHQVFIAVACHRTW